MKIAIIIYSAEPETVWNAFRLGSTCLAYDDEVKVFLLGKGVEAMSLKSLKYNIKEQVAIFLEHGGQMLGCELCCNTREDEMPFLKQDIGCDLGSMQDLYKITKEADKIISF